MENNQTKIYSITRDQIIGTKAFSNLNMMGKNLTSKTQNVKLIQHGFNVSKNKGFDFWSGQTISTPANRSIIKELISTL